MVCSKSKCPHTAAICTLPGRSAKAPETFWVDLETCEVLTLQAINCSYVHRVGRTGRAGSSGTAITLLTPADKPLQEELATSLASTPLQSQEGGQPTASVELPFRRATAVHVFRSSLLSISLLIDWSHFPPMPICTNRGRQSCMSFTSRWMHSKRY